MEEKMKITIVKGPRTSALYINDTLVKMFNKKNPSTTEVLMALGLECKTRSFIVDGYPDKLSLVFSRPSR